MHLSKEYFCLMRGMFIIGSCLIFLSESLLAQADFFPLGIYNYDVCGEEHTIDQPNELLLIDGLHVNYLYEVSYRAQSGLIDICNSRNGALRIALSDDDTTGRCFYPVYDHNPYSHNTILWRYISDNHAWNIRMDSVLIFIDHVYNRYKTNHAGIGAIRIAHEGYMDQRDHFAFIRRACGRIQQLFGDDVQSMVTHNIFHWDGGTRLTDFFSYMNDTLDVYQHEEYPFSVHNVGADPLHPTSCAPFWGSHYQDWHIDALLLGSYDQTRQALINSGNTHTRLEVAIQTQREYFPATQTFIRRPTESEIWLQAFLALSRGYKGIHAYVYRTNHAGNSWGLIDERTPRQQTIDSLCYYRNNANNYNRDPYSVVAQLYDHLAELADHILPLTVLDVFTWNGTSRGYILNIDGDIAEEDHPTIEVSLMDHPDDNYDYFLLVNRHCSSDNEGTPSSPQTLAVQTNKVGQHQIRDLYSGELFISGNGYFRNIIIGPGRGRLFELR